MGINPGGSPSERLTEFFEYVWESTEGFVYIPTLDRETGSWKKNLFPWPAAKKNAVGFVLAATATGVDVYFSPAIYVRPAVTKDAIKGSHVLWADYDGNAPDRWPGADSEAPNEGPTGSQRVPSLRVQSSTEDRQHVYWKLDSLCESVEAIETANRHIAYAVGADKTGWDCNQLLRPIETVNIGKENKKLPVKIFEETDRSYDIGSFKFDTTIKKTVVGSIDEEHLPKIEEILAKYIWDADTKELILKSAEDVPDGMRARALVRVGYTCAELGLSDSEIYTVLLFCDEKWGKYKGRSDRKARLVSIVVTSKEKYPHEVQTPTFEGLTNPKANTETTVDIKAVYSWGDFESEKFEFKWVIDELLPEGEIGLISADPGVGKSQIMLQLMLAFATGRHWIKWKTARVQRVGFLSLEMGIMGMKKLQMSINKGIPVADMQAVRENSFLIIPPTGFLDITTKEGYTWLDSVIKEYKLDGLIIDSLQKVILGELNSDEPVRAFWRRLRMLMGNNGIWSFVIHHNRKGNSERVKTTTMADIYGSPFISSEPRLIVNMYRKQDTDNIEFRVLKVSYAEQPPMCHVYRTKVLSYVVRDVFDGFQQSGNSEWIY